jgi:hypothetical protein
MDQLNKIHRSWFDAYIQKLIKKGEEFDKRSELMFAVCEKIPRFWKDVKEELKELMTEEVLDIMRNGRKKSRQITKKFLVEEWAELMFSKIIYDGYIYNNTDWLFEDDPVD